MENKTVSVEGRDSQSERLASSLLRLPGEIRNQIYTQLFASTRLTYSNQSLGGPSQYWIKPARHSLALLRVCRRIHAETKDLWLQHVLFNFKSIEDLMDKLCPLPVELLRQIRHVRVSARAVLMTPPGDYQNVYVRVPWLLKLLPGLRLDTLTVLGDVAPDALYLAIELFVSHGHGWRELRVLAPSSAVLAWKAETTIFGPPTLVRAPQPVTWEETMLKRDGKDSGTCVKIYRATMPHPGMIQQPSKREIYNQNPTLSSEPQNFGFETPRELQPEEEIRKEVLVVVRRGRGADLGDVGPVLALETGDLRAWSEGRGWKRLKRECIDMSFGSSSEDEDEGDEEERGEAREDEYGDREDYAFAGSFRK